MPSFVCCTFKDTSLAPAAPGSCDYKRSFNPAATGACGATVDPSGDGTFPTLRKAKPAQCVPEYWLYIFLLLDVKFTQARRVTAAVVVRAVSSDGDQHRARKISGVVVTQTNLTSSPAIIYSWG